MRRCHIRNGIACVYEFGGCRGKMKSHDTTICTLQKSLVITVVCCGFYLFTKTYRLRTRNTSGGGEEVQWWRWYCMLPPPKDEDGLGGSGERVGGPLNRAQTIRAEKGSRYGFLSWISNMQFPPSRASNEIAVSRNFFHFLLLLLGCCTAHKTHLFVVHI